MLKPGKILTESYLGEGTESEIGRKEEKRVLVRKCMWKVLPQARGEGTRPVLENVEVGLVQEWMERRRMMGVPRSHRRAGWL